LSEGIKLSPPFELTCNKNFPWNLSTIEPSIDFDYQDFTTFGVHISEQQSTIDNNEFGSLTYQEDIF
jgi:hypothetical protein